MVDEPRWHFLDTREQADGSTVVYHWRLDMTEFACMTSREVISRDSWRCANHVETVQPCQVGEWRTPTCTHENLSPNHSRPHCLICGMNGEVVTDQVLGGTP
ncbi:hypothetical protein GCM10010168_86080 [Actinoplanes ianthinogenes]|uniref:Uncharacterized protein n=1 Tax=Actinoplanes ianthinogenes TaxID=122358 RepID=A0ABN6CK21_9ACTN|nr:hypothetical protein [Actinoplanes ianthinogenes]BCJ45339.1 hypothetical protein Aiant_59960 [Actinoplanes ianthinogenes]GGR53881.1 hypothetical protein GCM10010168_86080 [Actinoplanes ianthinogenes]